MSPVDVVASAATCAALSVVAAASTLADVAELTVHIQFMPQTSASSVGPSPTIDSVLKPSVASRDFVASSTSPYRIKPSSVLTRHHARLYSPCSESVGDTIVVTGSVPTRMATPTVAVETRLPDDTRSWKTYRYPASAPDPSKTATLVLCARKIALPAAFVHGLAELATELSSVPPTTYACLSTHVHAYVSVAASSSGSRDAEPSSVMACATAMPTSRLDPVTDAPGDHDATMKMLGGASQMVRRIRTKCNGSRDHAPIATSGDAATTTSTLADEEVKVLPVPTDTVTVSVYV